MQIEMLANARNLRVTGDVSARFSVDGQTLFNTSNVLGRVAANNFVTADANLDISNARNLGVTAMFLPKVSVLMDKLYLTQVMF